jgi:hypothetical protein
MNDGGTQLQNLHMGGGRRGGGVVGVGVGGKVVGVGGGVSWGWVGGYSVCEVVRGVGPGYSVCKVVRVAFCKREPHLRQLHTTGASASPMHR